jgi:hypothetical protein
MLNKIYALPLFMLAIIAGTENAVAADNLFKNYVYDSPSASYTEAAGYRDCSSQVGATAKCIELTFVEHKFTASLVFKNDKLAMVSLLSPVDRELYLRAMDAVKKNFDMAAISDGKTLLDLLYLASKSTSAEDAATQFSNYESAALNAGNITYTFIENGMSISGAENFRHLVELAPANTRTVDIVINGIGNDAYLIIKFSFPKLDQKKLDLQSRKPVESF